MFLLIDKNTREPLMVGDKLKSCKNFAIAREMAKAVVNKNSELHKRLAKTNVDKVYAQNCVNYYEIIDIPYHTEMSSHNISWLNFHEILKNPLDK